MTQNEDRSSCTLRLGSAEGWRFCPIIIAFMTTSTDLISSCRSTLTRSYSQYNILTGSHFWIVFCSNNTDYWIPWPRLPCKTLTFSVIGTLQLTRITIFDDKVMIIITMPAFLISTLELLISVKLDTVSRALSIPEWQGLCLITMRSVSSLYPLFYVLQKFRL